MRKSSVDNKKSISVDSFDEQTINAVAPTKVEKRFSAPNIRKRFVFYNRFNQRGSLGVHIADDDSDALCIQDVQAYGIATGTCNTKTTIGENDLRFISADDRSLADSDDKKMNSCDDRIIRRKLNWRIGPLKKKHTKKKVRHVTASCKSVISTSEKTSKSMHTAHSIETARIRNSNFLSVGPRKLLFSSQERKLDGNSNSRFWTIGEFLNVEDDNSDLDDDRTVVVKLDEDEAFDPDTNQYRSVDLFHKTAAEANKSDLDRYSPACNSQLPPRNPSTREFSCKSSYISKIEDRSCEGFDLAHLQAVSEGCTVTNQSTKTSWTHCHNSIHHPSENSPKTPVQSSKKTAHSKSPPSIHTPSTVTSESFSCDETIVDVQRIQSELNLKAMQHLAMQHVHHREYPESVKVHKEMLRGVIAVYGASHTRVGTLHHNIATLYMRMGEFRKVLFHAQYAVQIRRLNLLKSVALSDLAVSYTQLGLALLELEEYDASLNMLHKALAIQKRNCSGFQMVKCSKLLNNIGCCLFKLKRWDEANVAFCDALEIQRRLLNTRDKLTNKKIEPTKEMDRRLLGIASTLCNLASIHFEREKYNDAFSYLEEALILQQSVLGDMHSISMSTERSLEFLQHDIELFNGKHSVQTRTKNEAQTCGSGQEIFEPTMKFYNPLKSFPDIQSELSLIFDDVLCSQKRFFQCIPNGSSHD
jgi:tetratricopeptide (TPR) repeat protein